MDNFNLEIEYRDNRLYISHDNSSGCYYTANSYEEVIELIKFYIAVNMME